MMCPKGAVIVKSVALTRQCLSDRVEKGYGRFFLTQERSVMVSVFSEVSPAVVYLGGFFLERLLGSFCGAFSLRLL